MVKRAVLRLLLFVAVVGPALPVPAATVGDSAPAWGSIAAGRAHLRAGPGKRFPIRWVFTAPRLPVQITDRQDNWREVRTPGGVSGWMHHSLLSGRRTALVVATAALRRRAAGDSGVRAEVRAGAVVTLEGRCRPDWCRVTAGEWTGYIDRATLWGPTDPE